ncbi:MAG: hypothetical protein LBQ00_09210 [Syntrophobacterales bacterium]|jgi:hypothetical protein|nr:hypothetical protein [Syntrophobacterales bacterium]
MTGITAQNLKDDKIYGLELEAISGLPGFSRRIFNQRIQKLGLVVTDRMIYLHPHRAQIPGNAGMCLILTPFPNGKARG